MFDIPYDFPKVRLDSLTGSGEYGLFVTDCNFHAGLLNAAYRGAMDGVVMDGPRLSCFKRMAICALLNGEKELCSKYLKLIENSPFESDFVQKYQAMLRDDKLIEADEELQHVKALYPKEDHFEQNYRSPAFLGYNVGLMEGSDATLTTSAAACLYSKDLQSFLPRAQILAQKGRSFPACMQQAIAIMASAAAPTAQPISAGGTLRKQRNYFVPARCQTLFERPPGFAPQLARTLARHLRLLLLHRKQRPEPGGATQLGSGKCGSKLRNCLNSASIFFSFSTTVVSRGLLPTK